MTVVSQLNGCPGSIFMAHLMGSGLLLAYNIIKHAQTTFFSAHTPPSLRTRSPSHQTPKKIKLAYPSNLTLQFSSATFQAIIDHIALLQSVIPNKHHMWLVTFKKNCRKKGRNTTMETEEAIPPSAIPEKPKNIWELTNIPFSSHLLLLLPSPCHPHIHTHTHDSKQNCRQHNL